MPLHPDAREIIDRRRLEHPGQAIRGGAPAAAPWAAWHGDS